MPTVPPPPTAPPPRPSALRRRLAPIRQDAPAHRLGFSLFLLVTAVLFVRPADVLPFLRGVEVYQYLIVLCLAASFPAVLAHLAPDRLEARPIDVLVLLLLPAGVLSHLTHAELGWAADVGVYFLKTLVYYLLFVSLVNTPRRLRLYLTTLVVCAAAVVVLAALDYHRVIKLPRISDKLDAVMALAEQNEARRMIGPGIFQDPNDVCVLIVVSLALLAGRLADPRAGLARWAWVVPLCVFAYGFYLTRSRGGLLALLAAGGVYVRLRYGWGRAVLLGAVGAPLLLAVLGGRQTAISATTNTGQERIELWNEGLVMFRANPLFGVGVDRYIESAGHVAHNSYMQAFGEMGLFGGACFLGAFYVALWGLWRLALPVPPDPARASGGVRVVPVLLDAELRQTHPALAAALAGYAAGMMTLSLNGLVVTYAFLGAASTYLSLAATAPPVPALRLDGTLVLRIIGLSLLFVAGMFVFVRLFLAV
jgi:O-antigen ligase